MPRWTQKLDAKGLLNFKIYNETEHRKKWQWVALQYDYLDYKGSRYKVCGRFTHVCVSICQLTMLLKTGRYKVCGRFTHACVSICRLTVLLKTGRYKVCGRFTHACVSICRLTVLLKTSRYKVCGRFTPVWASANWLCVKDG